MNGFGVGQAVSGSRGEPHFSRELVLCERALKWNLDWTSEWCHDGVTVEDWWTILHKSGKRMYVLDYT